MKTAIDEKALEILDSIGYPIVPRDYPFDWDDMIRVANYAAQFQKEWVDVPVKDIDTPLNRIALLFVDGTIQMYRDWDQSHRPVAAFVLPSPPKEK